MIRLLLLGLVISACRTPAPEADSARPAPAPDPPSSSAPPMSTSDVQLTLDKSAYASGADVQMTIVNGTKRELGYNPCTRIIERERDGAWNTVPEPDRICTMELRLLAAGETVTETTDLPSLQAGRYRIALIMSDMGSEGGRGTRAVSTGFQIR